MSELLVLVSVISRVLLSVIMSMYEICTHPQRLKFIEKFFALFRLALVAYTHIHINKQIKKNSNSLIDI